jgi:hypothetical protein
MKLKVFFLGSIQLDSNNITTKFINMAQLIWFIKVLKRLGNIDYPKLIIIDLDFMALDHIVFSDLPNFIDDLHMLFSLWENSRTRLCILHNPDKKSKDEIKIKLLNEIAIELSRLKIMCVIFDSNLLENHIIKLRNMMVETNIFMSKTFLYPFSGHVKSKFI